MRRSLVLLAICAFSRHGLGPSFAAEHLATPAVVNPPIRSTLRQALSLDGDWDFNLDGDSHVQKIKVPGCWEAQGVGGPGKSHPVDPEISVRDLRGTFVGTAWYRKTVDVPADWAGKNIWLKIGGVNSQGWFYINDQLIGHLNSYCGAYKFDITDLAKPGSPITIAAKVRNDVPSAKGLFNWIDRFGGLYRSIEVEATNETYIDYAWVEPKLDAKKAIVHVRVLGREADARVAVGSIIRWWHVSHDGDFKIDIPMQQMDLWSPESPKLYRADIALLQDGKEIDGWIERFGMRKWEVRNSDLYLNNARYFIRGFGDDFIYPLTLCSPASREEHRKHLQLARSYGFNYVRHHTHCEVPEFYEAADEVGIMVQPELPYYAAKASGGDEMFRPQEDLRELITHNRRYVSLSTISFGNEGHMGSPLDLQMYNLAKSLDPSRLIIHQDGGKNTPENSDWGKGVDVKHEYLNLAVEEDPRIDTKYTGALLPPRRREDFRREVEKLGLPVDLAESCFDAGHELQRVYQKQGIEDARHDPNCDGYIYWTMVDVGSPAAQGLLNQFWEPKRSTPEYFRQFNGPHVILAKIDRTIATAGEKISFTFAGFKPQWKLMNFTGEGNGNIVVPAIDKPMKTQLTATLGDASNSWDIWLLPPPRDPPKQLNVTITDKLNEKIIADMHAGKRVLLTDLGHDFAVIRPGVKLGWWSLSKQTGTAIAKHAAFGDFPHEGFLSPLLFRIFDTGVTWNDIRGVEPLMLSHAGDDWLVYTFEAKVGEGGLLATGLNIRADVPEARYLLDQFTRYLASDQFKPSGTFDPKPR